MPLFALNNIKANPFRDIAQYPIKPEKIAALKESIEKTGFWDNIVARKCKGGAEIAYGHHRLTALNKLFGPNHKVDLIIKELTNETMIQIMAHENMTEWGHNVSVEHETIRAVVVAYGDGLISLPVPERTDPKLIRYAPSFKQESDVANSRPGHPYTAQSVAKFIGWMEPNGKKPQERVIDALFALEFIEIGLLKGSDFQGLSKSAAKAVIQETRRTYENKQLEAEYQRKHPTTKSIPFATHVGRTISEGIKSGMFGYKQARDVGTKMRNEVRTDREIPDIHTFEKNLARDINRILDFDDPLTKRLNELLKFKDDLLDGGDLLVKELDNVADRFHLHSNNFCNKRKKLTEKSAGIESRIN